MPHADLKVGILALQGAFAAHQRMLGKIEIDSQEVRSGHDLSKCGALILPGGESTTMIHLLKTEKLWDPLQEFAKSRPLFGTCAGMILMTQLGLLDIAVQRNGYGRQIHSFAASISLSLPTETEVEAIFIRAPRIAHLLSDRVEVLGKYQGEAVCIQQGHHLATTFHPELTDDSTLHEHFVRLLSKSSDTSLGRNLANSSAAMLPS